MKFTLSIIIALVFLTLPAQISAADFNMQVDPLSFSLLTPAGKSNPLVLNLNSPGSNDLTLYPIAFDWKLAKGQFHFSISDWFSFKPAKFLITDGNDRTLNFNLKAPGDSEVGEYYKVVGVSTREGYDGEPKDDPALMIGVPMAIQVARGATGGSTDSGTNSGLYSYIKVRSFTANYNPLNQTETFHFELKNEGNIASAPSGYLSIKTSGGQVLGSLEFNKEKYYILPQDSHNFEINFRPNKTILGNMQADLVIGYENGITREPSQLASSIQFFYISYEYMVGAPASTAFFVLFKKFKSLGLKPQFMFLRYYLLLGGFLTILYLGLNAWPKATPNTLGVSDHIIQPITASARVVDTIGFSQDPNNHHLIRVRSKSSRGWKLWSFKATHPYVIAEDSGTIYEKMVTLTDIETHYPLLLLPKIFF